MPEDKPNEQSRPNPALSGAEPPAVTATIQPPPLSADPPAGRKHRRWPWVVIAVAVVLGIGVLVLLHLLTPPPKPHAPAPVEIAMAKAQKGSIPVYVDGLGTVTPRATVTVSSRVDGQINKVNQTEGQKVPEGSVLVEIDSRPYAAQLMTAQGQLDRDKELLKEANINLGRYRDAYKQSAIPKQQFDDEASLVRQLEGTVKLDEGQVASAQTQVDYCTIKSPVPGVGLVGLRRVDAGNIVHATDTTGMMVVTQLAPITVVFSVAEDYLPAIQEQLRQGHTLSVEALDRANLKTISTGTLLALDSQIDVTTGTIRLKAQFENKDDALFPNQFVNARLLLTTLNDVTLVPTGAIQRGSEGAFVYIVKEDNTLEARPVDVGITEGAVASVTKLNPDETIALDNFNRLQDGTAVTERKAAPAAADPATPKGAKSPKGQKP